MPLRFGNRVFAPGVPGTLALLVALAGMVNLGLWQLRRADEKQALLDAYTAGQTSTVALTATNARQLPRYQRVSARGRYRPDRQLLLDNMPSGTGAPGYHVLTPLELDDGSLLLVDRGWVPLGRDRTALPAIDVDAEPRQVTGLLDGLPQPGMRLGTAEIPAADWPLVLNFPEYGTLTSMYGDALLEPILLLDPEAADGFERSWEARFGFGPERHVGYAIQWFALGLALLVIYVVVNLKKAPRPDRESGR